MSVKMGKGAEHNESAANDGLKGTTEMNCYRPCLVAAAALCLALGTAGIAVADPKLTPDQHMVCRMYNDGLSASQIVGRYVNGHQLTLEVVASVSIFSTPTGSIMGWVPAPVCEGI